MIKWIYLYGRPPELLFYQFQFAAANTPLKGSQNK